MGSDSKGGSGAKQYDYFGTLFAAVCLGPVDYLYAVIADGKTIYENTGGLARSGNYTAITGSIDSKYFTNGGYARFIWGTDAQTASTIAAANGHPGYRRVAGLELVNFLFGRERSTAPNIEIICARLPVCDTGLCASIHNVFDDGQVNPVAVLAEMFTSIYGLGWDASRLDATTWAEAASYCYTNRTTCFCSPLFTNYGDIRSAAAQLLSVFDAALAWTTTGTLALKLLKWGTDPGGLTTLDANHFTDRPALRAGGWAEVPTAVVCRYVDRDRKYKEADEKLDNLVALQARAEDDRRTVEFPGVTRRDQVVALAGQAIRRQLHPPVGADLVVRRGHAAFYPGDKLKVDVDPEPGGSGVEHLAVVTERRDDGYGPIKLSVKFDPIAGSAPYTPTFTPATPQAAECDGIDTALILPVAPSSIAIVARRPQADAIGFRVYFDTDSGGTFAELGKQAGFAVRCSLDASVSMDDTVFRLTLTDGPDDWDAYLAGRTAGTEVEAARDVLLLVIANVTAGVIDVDADGLPELEFCSVVSRAAVDSDTHDYTVLRARRGLNERDWTTGAEVWLIPGESLVSWTHEYMGTLLRAGGTGYVELSAFTGYVEDEATLNQFPVEFPSAFLIPPQIAWTTPGSTPYTLATTGLLTPDADLADADGNLVRLELFSVDSGGVVTVHLNAVIPPTTATTLADCFTAAGVSGTIDLGTQTVADQYFTLTLRATDSSGSVIESSRTLVLPGSSGAGLRGVTYTPDNGISPVQLTLTVGGTATKIHYAVRPLGSAAPAGYITVNSTSVIFRIAGDYRIWSRPSDGVNNGGWEFRDYFRDGGL